MFSNNMQRTPGTLASYEKIYENALRRIGSDEHLARHLLEVAPTLSRATVRQYKAAFSRAWIEKGRDDLVEVVRNARGEKQPIRKTAAKKAKAFQWPDLLRLLGVLERKNEKVAAVWLRAGYITGLRPCEWRFARLEENRLVVANAKSTNGRAHGETRTLHVESDQELRNIAALIFQLRLDFKSQYAHVRYAIRVAALSIWPKRKLLPSLYTARHMFAAEAKKRLPKVDVAAMMGHATDRTAGQHYARKTTAKGGLIVRPSSVDIAAVKLKASSGAHTEVHQSLKSRAGPA